LDFRGIKYCTGLSINQDKNHPWSNPISRLHLPTPWTDIKDLGRTIASLRDFNSDLID